jgi:outer membrane protein
MNLTCALRRSLLWACALTALNSCGCASVFLTDWGIHAHPSPRPGRDLPLDWAGHTPVQGKDGAREVDLTLDGAVAFALVNNPSIRSSLENDEKAKGALLSALSVCLPRSGLSLLYSRVDGVSEMKTTDSSGGITTIPLSALDNYKAEITLRQPLFLGGRGYNAYVLSGIGREMSGLTTRAVIQQIAYLVRQSYIDVLFTRQVQTVLEMALDATRVHLKDVEIRLAQGMATEFDRLRAGVQVSNAAAAIVQSRNDLETARTSFLAILGLPPDSRPVLRDALVHVRVRVDEQQCLRRALESHLNIKQSELAVRMQGKKVDLAVGGLLPSVYAFFNWGWEKPSQKNFGGTGGGDYWNTGLSVDIPLFDGFDGIGKMRSESAALRQARWGHEETTRRVILEVRKAVAALENAEEFVESQAENVRQAEEGQRLAEAGYSAGTQTALDVLDAQTALTAARLNHLKAIYGHMTSRFALEYAKGAYDPGEGSR